MKVLVSLLNPNIHKLSKNHDILYSVSIYTDKNIYRVKPELPVTALLYRLFAKINKSLESGIFSMTLIASQL